MQVCVGFAPWSSSRRWAAPAVASSDDDGSSGGSGVHPPDPVHGDGDRRCHLSGAQEPSGDLLISRSVFHDDLVRAEVRARQLLAQPGLTVWTEGVTGFTELDIAVEVVGLRNIVAELRGPTRSSRLWSSARTSTRRQT